MNGTAWRTTCAKLNLSSISNQCWCSFSYYSIHDQMGVKLLTRLRLEFSHLGNLKFHHKLKDCIRYMCNWGTEIGTTRYFLLALPFSCQWKIKSPWRPLSGRSSGRSYPQDGLRVSGLWSRQKSRVLCPTFWICSKSQRVRELLTWNKKHFSSFLKGFHRSK